MTKGICVGGPELPREPLRRRIPRVPFEPLARYPLPQPLHCYGPALARAFYRGRRRGSLTVKAADLLATRVLGVHPYDVWGRQWYVSVHPDRFQ